MDVQILIVVLIIAGALIYAAFGMVKKARAFRGKGECGDDCGAGRNQKKLCNNVVWPSNKNSLPKACVRCSYRRSPFPWPM